MNSHWIGSTVEELDTPALVVDLEKMERNIASIVSTLRDLRVGWRPHVKCHKSPDTALRLVTAGAIGITCAKLGEAEVMADAGLDNILIANQVVGPVKMRRLVALRRRADVTVAVDDPAQIEQLAAAAREADVTLPVGVELNIGQNRCGVDPGQPAVALSHLVQETAGPPH